MNNKGIPKALVRAVMSLYKGAKTKVKVGTHLFEDFKVNVGVHQGSFLSQLLFAIVIDVATNIFLFRAALRSDFFIYLNLSNILFKTYT